jgi:pimeloyl-ACP methyl ester carboxylesterase
MMYLGGALAVYLGLCLALALSYVGHKTKRPFVDRNFPRMDADGLPMQASSGDAARPIVLLIHGYGGSPNSWRELASEMRCREWGVVIPWMCGHGENPESRVSFGPREALEVRRAVRWIRKNWGTERPLVVVGVSLGGAATWLASDELGIDAIVTEGTFTRLDLARRRWMNLLVPGGAAVLAPVNVFGSWLSGTDVSAVNPINHAAAWRGRPGLIVHCENDILMPQSEAEAFASETGWDVWVVLGRGHAEAQLDSIEFTDRIETLIPR